jgi:hypothetical protein
MKPPQFIVAVLLSLVSLVLVINLIFMSQKNQSLQAQLQQQQQQIADGSRYQQVGVNILKEIANASLKDDTLKDVLANNGYSVTPKASAAPVPAATP